MKIDVTAEDIAKGEKANPSSCPLALAFKRAGFKRCDIYLGQALLSGHRVYLPAVATEFYRRFDKGLPVSPFSFEISASEISKGGGS